MQCSALKPYMLHVCLTAERESPAPFTEQNFLHRERNKMAGVKWEPTLQWPRMSNLMAWWFFHLVKSQPCYFGHGEGKCLAGSCPLGQRTGKDLRGHDHTLAAGKERGCTCWGKVTGYLLFSTNSAKALPLPWTLGSLHISTLISAGQWHHF